MRDTAQLAGIAAFITNGMIPAGARARLFRTWASLLAMMPVGGARVWGNSTWAPDDTDTMRAAGRTFGAFFSVKDFYSTPGAAETNSSCDIDAGHNSSMSSYVQALGVRARSAGVAVAAALAHTATRKRPRAAGELRPVTVRAAMAAALEETGPLMAKHYKEWGPQANAGSPSEQAGRWGGVIFPDATRVPLPPAPSFKMYCVYGVGIMSERSYYYARNATASAEAARATAACTNGEGDDPTCARLDPEGTFNAQGGTFNWRIDTGVNIPESGLEYGVQMTDGDLTVPLISTGAMCHGGWRSARLNPARCRIVTREKLHQATTVVSDPARSGPASGHHVDIMGNDDMLMDALAVVSGHGDELEDEIHSEVANITANIDWEAEDGWDE
ncbi:hypothetical protein FOA52_014704 [Chlamydomonas sp. UWO 241]|nr:hypothetical protein FOA52_014704 [Chlamydomonas sp. UWO 241]